MVMLNSRRIVEKTVKTTRVPAIYTHRFYGQATTVPA